MLLLEVRSLSECPIRLGILAANGIFEVMEKNNDSHTKPLKTIIPVSSGSPVTKDDEIEHVCQILCT